MSSPEYASSDATLGPPAVQCLVVYDKATGDVVHVHQTVTYAGATQLPEQPADRARRLAGRGDDVEVLEVRREELIRGKPLSVDAATGRLRPA